MKAIMMQIKNQDDINMGGAYDRYITLMKALVNEGCEVHHISPKGFSNFKHSNLIHHGIANISFYPSFLPFYILTFFKMRKINKTNYIDFIITFSSIEAVMGVIFNKMFNKKTKVIACFRADTVSHYNISHKKFKSKFLSAFLNFIDSIVVNNSDLLIFLSKKNRNDILDRVGYAKKDNVTVIYNGITPRLQLLSKENGVKINKDIVIGFVGLLYENKGLSYLIQSFSNVKNHLTNAILVIIGDGPDKQKFIKLVEELNLHDDVIFTGYKTNPIKYTKCFDLLIVPSLVEEAFGMVILEALYVGTPVFGSKVGGIPEVLKYDELLFDVKTQELELKILDFFQNKKSHENIVNLCNKRKDVFMFDWSSKMINSIKKRFNDVK